MMTEMRAQSDYLLQPKTTPGAQVVQAGEDSWRLEIPGGPGGRYRLAQLDDYNSLRRSRFPWRAPCGLELQARASAQIIPGTWGFGFWNDPFSMGALSQSGGLRLPTLPNAAWFFYAGPPNYLSLRDDQPAQGWLAQVFQAPSRPAVTLGLSALLAPLAFLPVTGRWVRRLLRRTLYQQAASVTVDITEWHTYRLDWRPEALLFQVDGQVALKTNLSPPGQLGLVLWIDNQYAAWGADGRPRWGMLGNPQIAWIELKDLQIYSLED